MIVCKSGFNSARRVYFYFSYFCQFRCTRPSWIPLPVSYRQTQRNGSQRPLAAPHDPHGTSPETLSRVSQCSFCSASGQRSTIFIDFPPNSVSATVSSSTAGRRWELQMGGWSVFASAVFAQEQDCKSIIPLDVPRALCHRRTSSVKFRTAFPSSRFQIIL